MSYTEYTPPVVLQNMDVESIHQRMLSVLPPNINKFKGGGAWDLTRPAAEEKALMTNEMNVVIQIMFPQFAYDEWLDYHAKAVGLTRKAANYATGNANVTGLPGTTIPVGYLFATPAVDGPNLEFIVTQQVVIAGDGTALVPIKCTTAGSVGNVDAQMITLMVSPLKGIKTLINNAAMSGGTDSESDDGLRDRIFQSDSENDASNSGTPADYKRWALEVNGVGGAVVKPESDGPGTGTVKLIIVDGNGEPANQSILDAVYDHIISPNDKMARLAPIGATLTVVAPVSEIINVSATVQIADVLLDDIKASFASKLQSYFTQAANDHVVRYSVISKLLSEVIGVLDHQGLSINGSNVNLPLDDDIYPVLGSLDGVILS